MNVIWAAPALYDLRSIENYIAEDNPLTAKKTVLAIRSYTVKQLHAPRLGRVGRVSGTYELVIPKLPYIVVYRCEPGTAYILRVYHTSRQWPEEF